MSLWVERLRWYLSVRDAIDLPEIDERTRESFPYEWDNAVLRFTRLDAAVEQGLLSPSEQGDFAQPACEMSRLAPRMQRLRLGLPDQDVLARAANRPVPIPSA